MAGDTTLYKAADGAVTTTGASSASHKLRNDRALSVQSEWTVTTPAAKTFISGAASVKTLTFPSEATAVDGDFVVLEDSAGTQWALALSKEGAEVQTFTFLAKASCVERDFMIFYDTAGGAWAIGVNKSGTATAPTAQAWTDIAAARKAQVNISSATTAAQVAALYVTAMNALTGFTDLFTLTDNTDGTVTVTSDDVGPVADPVSYKGDAGTTAGTTPTGTSIVGEETTAGYLTAEPTDEAWTAVAAANKDILDVTGLSTAIAIAAAAETALDALATFTAALLTDDTAGDGTMTVTCVEVGDTDDPVVSNADGSDVGTITFVETTPGTGGVNVGSNTVLSTAHTMVTGLKVRLTTSDADLPAGLAGATDYYVIATDANHLKFATSHANALAGTAVNITDIGTGTHTVTAEALAAAIKLQKSSNGTTWYDVHDDEVIGGANSQTITATGGVLWTIPDACWNYVRQYVTLTGGQVTFDTLATSK